MLDIDEKNWLARRICSGEKSDRYNYIYPFTNENISSTNNERIGSVIELN